MFYPHNQNSDRQTGILNKYSIQTKTQDFFLYMVEWRLAVTFKLYYLK